MTPLYGHTSPDTAYLVADYPYGRTVRCRIHYWIEHSATKGFRFVSQTENPKTLRWNKPKASTYALFAMCMYLDDNNHVQCARITEYSTAVEALAFVTNFPGAELAILRSFADKKVQYLQGCIAGKIVLTINGARQPWTESDTVSHKAELPTWQSVATTVA